MPKPTLKQDVVFASIPSQIWFERTLPRKAFLASDFNGGTAKIIHLTVGSSSRWTAVVPVHLPLPTRPLKLLSISWTRLALAGSLQAHSATPEQAVERLPSARGSSVCPLGPGSPPRLAQSVSRIALPLPSTPRAVCLLEYGAFKQNALALSCTPSPSHFRM